MKKAPDHIEGLDWRLNNLTYTTAPFTIPGTSRVVPAESAVTQAAVVRWEAGRVGLSVPNATALFLDTSKQEHDGATELLATCIRDQDEFGMLPTDGIYAYLQRIMASAVFACTALEAFVNEMVPDGYVHVVTEKAYSRSYAKEQIERHVNLDVKLGDVLPGALGVKSPKGGKLWSNYQKLRDLRDRIVHMKTADRLCAGEAPSSIWNHLISPRVPPTCAPARALITFFMEKTANPPRWFVKCPF